MTGVFFDEQAPQALVDAVDRAREMQWDGGAIRRHALRFDLPEFRARMYDLLSRAVGTAVGPEDDAR